MSTQCAAVRTHRSAITVAPQKWPSNRLRVADRGLREGILTEMMAADGVWRRGANPWRNRPKWNGQ